MAVHPTFKASTALSYTTATGTGDTATTTTWQQATRGLNITQAQANPTTTVRRSTAQQSTQQVQPL
jgi:hypothetical protein